MRSPEATTLAAHPVLAAVLEARAELGQALTCVHRGDPEGALRSEARSRSLLEGLTLAGTTPEVLEQLRGAARDVELVRSIVRQALHEVAVELARVRAEVRVARGYRTADASAGALDVPA